MKIAALIPARSGSKRVPNKNLRTILGQSLVERAIRSAQLSQCFSDVYLSTDDCEAARIGEEMGASILPRSAGLSDDTAVLDDVVIDSITRMERLGRGTDAVCLMNPTAPMRTLDDVRGAVSLFIESQVPFVSTAVEYSHHPLYALEKNDTGHLRPFFRADIFRFDRKLLPTLYRPIAVARVGRCEAILDQGTTFGTPMLLYEIATRSALDIDDPVDLEFADFLMRKHGDPLR